jgi:transglutaminase-like putative cysteine protease
MRVAITHTTRLDYSMPVAQQVTDARLGPLVDAHQRWERYQLQVQPAAAVRYYKDGFGNSAHLITIARPHEFIEFVAGGEVQTLLADPFAPPATPPPPLTPAQEIEYLSPSALVEQSPELEALAAPHRPGGPREVFEAVQRLMALVYDGFIYEQHVTDVATTIGDVLRVRAGVCQDFAHLLIGLCRAVGIPARYVSGYIVTSGHTQTARSGGQSQSQSQSQSQGPATPGSPERGAGASHAWIEAFTPTHGWRGFDPTNNLVASDHHVKMAIGRDYRDVPPTRGTYRGTADERLSVAVTARRLD